MGNLTQSTSWNVRCASQDDLGFLQQMLFEAAAWDPTREQRPFREVLDDPHTARYIAGWGRQGDSALIAELAGVGKIGAAWYRLFSAEEPGYGYISSSVPEITVGVSPESRRRGVGSALVAGLVSLARDSGFDSLSLSVEKRNPAIRLYERHGFTKVGTSGESWTMCLGFVGYAAEGMKHSQYGVVGQRGRPTPQEGE